MNIRALTEQIVGAASRESDPMRRADVLRNGAGVFARLASDPANARHAGRLTSVGLDLAGAASQAQQSVTTTDFAQLLRDTQQAYEELGPEAATLSTAAQDIQAIRRPLALAQDPDQNPGFSIAPASFNKDSTLGRSGFFKFDPDEEEKRQGVLQSQTVAFWQGTKREAQAMTIDVGPTLLPLAAENSAKFPPNARPYALIEYGSDGHKQTSVFTDVGLGRRMTVVGNYISVNIGMDPPRVGFPAATMALGASIGTFAAPSVAPATRTIYFDDLTPNVSSVFVNIPMRAVQLLPPQVSLFGVLTVGFFDFSGTFISQWQNNFAVPPQFLTPIPIPNDAFLFNVKNTLGGEVRAIFELSL